MIYNPILPCQGLATFVHTEALVSEDDIIHAHIETLRFALVLFSKHIINIVVNVASYNADLLNILK